MYGHPDAVRHSVRMPYIYLLILTFLSQSKLAWLTPNLGILSISVCSFWLCGSVVANPIIYRLVPSPSRFETRQWYACTCPVSGQSLRCLLHCFSGLCTKIKTAKQTFSIFFFCEREPRSIFERKVWSEYVASRHPKTSKKRCFAVSTKKAWLKLFSFKSRFCINLQE